MRAFTLAALLLATASATTVIAEEYADVHACDEYAAHPNDPHRWAKGVLDDDIIPGPAVKYCREAVEDHGETPRFQFQLGRALWAAHKLEEGLQVFLNLEENVNYPPVYAYLGDAYMYGIGGIEEDQELAVSLYQIADDGGFAPASEVLAALAGNSFDDAQAEVQQAMPAPQTQVLPQQQNAVPVQQVRPFDPTIYSEPTMIQALYTGDFSKIKNGAMGSTGKMMGMSVSNALIYLGNFNSQFAGTYNFKDPTCIQIYNPRVAKTIERKGMNSMTGGLLNNSGNMQQLGAEGLMFGLNSIMSFMDEMQQPNAMGNMIGNVHEMEVLGESAAKDASRIIQTYGCQHPDVQRIYANLVAYVEGKPPVVSPQEMQRRQIEKEQKAALQRKKQEEAAARAEQKRQKAFRTAAANACMDRFSKQPFCSCLINNLEPYELTEADWTSLGSDFKYVIEIGKNYAGFSETLKDCRAEG
jgi:aspartate/glutamate racemase